MNDRIPAGKLDSLALCIATGEMLISEWAKVECVAERTAYRWAKREGVRARVEKIRGERIDRAIGILSRGATHAVAALLKIIGANSEEPGAVRVAAAKAILASIHELSAHASLNDRITALETAHRKKKPK